MSKEIEKKKFFGCRSKVFVGSYVLYLLLDLSKLHLSYNFAFSTAFTLVGIALLLRCTYKTTNFKEMGIVKKVGVGVLELIISFVLITMATTFATNTSFAITGDRYQLNCQSRDVQNTVKIALQRIDETKFDKVTILNIEELSSTKNNVTCKAKIKADDEFLYVEYNSTYKPENKYVYTLIRSINP